MFKLYVCVKDEITKDRISDIAKDIYIKDNTFKYSIIRAKYGNCKYLLVVNCRNKDQAHKRGMWFVNNVDSSLTYWVKEVSDE